MPDFTYIGDEGRTYPSLPAPANEPEVGETYTLRKDPGDDRWEKATSGKHPKKADQPDQAAPTENKES